MQQLIEKLAGNKFLPLSDDPRLLPNGTGVYIVCARNIKIREEKAQEIQQKNMKFMPVSKLMRKSIVIKPLASFSSM